MTIRSLTLTIAVLTVLAASLGFAQQYAFVPPQRAEVNVDMGNPPASTAYGGAAAPSNARASTGAATATTAPSTASATPQAGAGQSQYNYPSVPMQPTIIVVPPATPTPAVPASADGTNHEYNVVRYITWVFLALGLIAMFIWRNALWGQLMNLLNHGGGLNGNQNQRHENALLVSHSLVEQSEGAYRVMVLSSGSMSVTGNRPEGSAAAGGHNPLRPPAAAAAPVPVASGAQVAVINTALTAAGVAAPTPAQLDEATTVVVNNWRTFGTGAARQTAANTAVQRALQRAGLI